MASPGQLQMNFARWALVMVPFLVLLGAISGVVAGSGTNNHWFVLLAKPAAMPPGWVFGVVWTLLYAMMGLACAMILDARGASGRGRALGLFSVQFVLNLAWSPLFFAQHQVHASVFLLALILLAAVGTTLSFGPIRRLAAWLLLPYLIWLSFALVLNYQIDQLNPNAAHLGRQIGITHIVGT